MTLRVLVVGGYGNFGSIICRYLIHRPGVHLLISGRDPARLAAKVEALRAEGGQPCEGWCGDAMGEEWAPALKTLGIDWVIHTGGPFQGQSYAVAQGCIEAGVNYCDLADCRQFVGGIGGLDTQARAAGVTLLSGCSSVPTLSSAIIDEHRQRFARIDRIEHGISSSAKMPGVSTILGVLAYAGRPIQQLKDGQPHPVIGWQGLALRTLPRLGTRLVANVDVPDLDLFAARYGAHTLSFKAGAGLKVAGLANALLAQAVKLGLVRDPAPWAVRLHRCGTWFEWLGDGLSAMYVDVHGLGQDGQPLSMAAQLTATHDHGPEIPSCAAVAVILKVLDGQALLPGARACIGEVSLEQYLRAIDDPLHLQMQVEFSR
ncbi:saccharopine dehydrogenase family protein [Pseudomonas sessilinigenes]|uniref:Saccharopine dehydrogenase NADP-binding domain-containing protein n=1 Tax=Pseudomonas sessilinigenes TaxID=658629 RepID=A0ABX8MX09_9PSED|nr:saccharopine dehydrogenase NADP-binding domain-containing protein [Pseudomonas sessilinigenes]AZC24042.1 Saccharopine dehydrogenase [Pseudomonas sessilinigenes]QXH43005.1 saccharopine dehydrogenase NADP-binding domain-containing protein [Pseudomonas sessilinigenes]